MKILHLIKSHWPIALILIAAAVLRFWRLEELTTFGGDQGYDFLIVKRMIVDGKFTLLGPKIGPYNQIGNLYLGPAYYYLLAPFLFLFQLDPIGSAVMTVIFALGTICLIYIIGTKFLSKSIAILSSSFYATNAFLVDQSRASSNPHLIPFFAALATYSTLEIAVKKSKSIVWPLLCGMCLGIMFQLHYLTISFALSALIILLIKRNFKQLPLVFLSFLVSISPQIIFELRHEFFISNIFLKQLSSGQNISTIGQFGNQLSISLQKIFLIFISINKFLYILIPALIVLIIIHLRKNRKSTLTISFLISTIIFGLISASIYSRNLELHYFASIYPSLSILIAASSVTLFYLFRNVAIKTMIIIIILQVFTSNLLSLNLSRQEGFTMPKGWNLKGIKTASEIIAGDVTSGKTFNIASTLDGDTRARPYRYLTEVEGKIPQDVEHYPDSEVLYLISRDDQDAIKSYTVWEVASFAPFTIKKQWDIQNGIKLYKLTKI